MSTAINPKGPRILEPDATPATWAQTYLTSTVGAKVLVAITGLSLTLFVLFHMLGNLKIFFGAESINEYAHFLKHSLGAYLWIARIGLLTVFVLHVCLTIWLKAKTNAARPISYNYHRTAQATIQSRTMLTTGLLILAFVIFHLAHYTFAWVTEVENPDGTLTNYLKLKDEYGHHDVYRMLVAGFQVSWIAAIYLFYQLTLLLHLSHGLQSSIQTLGLKGTRFAPVWVALGYLVTFTIVGGNCAIIVAVWTGLIY